MTTHVAEHRPSESLSPLIPSTVQLGATSAAALEDDATAPERAPVRLGHYVLLQRIGQGGMGVVHAAYDERLDRKVAIKLLRGGGPARARERLIREAQALARLSHPNVVAIHEIGELEGRNFLVMELIDGVTLKQWRQERPRSHAEILAVFRAAGLGLAAAHAKGLVHRDFKPDNVMIRSDGRVVVMDFGLARGDERAELAPDDAPRSSADTRDELDSSSGDSHESGATAKQSDSVRSSELQRTLTVTGAIMGTPGYIPPEQIHGERVSDRGDQFSFCVALWEALHDQRPFRGTHIQAYARSLLADEPLGSADDGEVPAWLRDVLLRGLALDPGARWPSMDALLDALQRDPTHRRRRFAVVAGLLGFVLALATGAYVADEREHQRQADRLAALRSTCMREAQALTADWTPARAETIAQVFARANPAVGDALWQHTRHWLDDYATQWSAISMRACVETEIEQTRSASSRLAVVDCLAEGHAAFVGVIEALETGDRNIAGSATTTVTRLAPPASCLDEALLLHREPLPDDLRAQIIALRVRLEHARARVIADDFSGALADAETLRSDAEALAWNPLITEAELVIATAQTGLGKLDEAEQAAERALRAAIAEDDELGTLTATTHLTQIVGIKLGRIEDGRAWARLGEQLIARLGLEGSAHEAALLDRISALLGPSGAYDEALAYAERAVASHEALYGREHPSYAGALLTLANNLSRVGRYADSLATLRRALPVVETAYGPEHSAAANLHNNLGIQLQFNGDYRAAQAEFERAVAIWEQLGVESPKLGTALNNLAASYEMHGEPERALAMHHRALALFEGTLGSSHPSIAMTHVFMGKALTRLGRYDEALEQLRRGQTIYADTLGANHPDVHQVSTDIGDTLLAKGDAAAALAEFQAALTGWQATLEPDHPRLVWAWLGIGSAMIELGDLEGAREPLERAVEMRERSGAEPELSDARFALARALVHSDPDRARALAEAAVTGYRSAGPFAADELAQVEAWLRSP